MKLERVSTALGHPAVGAVCRLILGGIFVYASYPKLMEPGNFARLVYGYRVIHPDLVNLVGVTFPWLEAVAGAFLVVGYCQEAASSSSRGSSGSSWRPASSRSCAGSR